MPLFNERDLVNFVILLSTWLSLVMVAGLKSIYCMTLVDIHLQCTWLGCFLSQGAWGIERYLNIPLSYWLDICGAISMWLRPDLHYFNFKFQNLWVLVFNLVELLFFKKRCFLSLCFNDMMTWIFLLVYSTWSDARQ